LIDIQRPTHINNKPLPRGKRSLISTAEATWPKVSIFVSLLVLMPIAALVWSASNPEENVWGHLVNSVLPIYIINSVILMVGVGVGVIVVGTGTAWLIAMCKFPGHKLFSWMLILPLAMPAYVIAYVYTDILEYSGPLQSSLRTFFGWKSSQDYWFPEIRSHTGAIILLSLVLYPYVYALARAAFLEQSASMLEVGRTLGRNALQNFVSISLPLARPAIVIGTTLALMETLSDFGTVDYFAVRTLTSGIFDVWFGMENRGGAAQIALVLLSFVVLLVWLESSSRRQQRVHNTWKKTASIKVHLNGWHSYAAIIFCLFPVFFGFILPTVFLVAYVLHNVELLWLGNYLEYALNSIILASAAAIICMVMGIFLGYSSRLSNNWIVKIAVRMSTFGYALPGAALAIGLLIAFGGINSLCNQTWQFLFNTSPGFFLGGGLVALLFAYTIRFLAIGVGSAESGLGKVTPNMDMASRTLGHGPASTLCKIHIPLLKSSLITGCVLIFVDTMKELSATLILRPFNFETLATFVYQYASDELLQECAPAALTIVLAGLVPVILLNMVIDARR